METNFSKVVVEKVEPHKFKQGVNQAQLRQAVETVYDGVKVSNDKKDNIFAAEEFGINGATYNNSRVGWIDVPTGETAESVQARLANFPNARLRRELSLEPILDQDQINIINVGFTGERLKEFLTQNNIQGDHWNEECREVMRSMINNRQLVIYGENEEGNDPEAPVLFNGLKQYRRIEFKSGVNTKDAEDIDYRPAQFAKSHVKQSLVLTDTVKAEELVNKD